MIIVVFQVKEKEGTQYTCQLLNSMEDFERKKLQGQQ